MSKQLDVNADKLVSVIIPSKNRHDFLAQAVTSVFHQTYRPIELLVIDDGSDEPVNLDKVIPSDEQFSYQIIRNEQSKGVAAARNQGICSAKGRWVALLDDDDEWLKEKTAMQIEALSKADDNSIRGVSCHLILQDTDRNEIGRSTRALTRDKLLSDLLYADNNLEPTTLFLERSVFDEVGLYKEDFPTAEDREWLLRFLIKNNIHVIDDYLVRFTLHRGVRLTLNHQAMKLGEEKLLEVVKLNVKLLGGHYRRAVGYRYAKLAHETILAREYKKSLLLYLRAIFIYPMDYRAIAGFSIALFGPTIYRRILSMRMERLK